MTDDGWYLTGDIGVLEAEKKIRIIDRCKNVFKLVGAVSLVWGHYFIRNEAISVNRPFA